MNKDGKDSTSTDEFLEEYLSFTRADVLQYGWIKVLAGLLIISYFSFIDIYVNQYVASFYNRVLPLVVMLTFLVLNVVYFKKNNRYVVCFYNAALLSSLIMIYGIIVVSYKTHLFPQATEGAVLTLAIISIDLRGGIKTVLLGIITPSVILIVVLLVFHGYINAEDTVHLSHILTMVIIGSIFCILREKMLFASFKNKYQLQEEKKRSEELSEKLIINNEQLNLQNDEIVKQHDFVQFQNELLKTQKNQITSSIVYAKRIQTALFSSDDTIRQAFSDYFILYYPKDIVSGDFYWSATMGSTVLFALADCTGHGIPAAFMSILGISYLNEITVKQDDVKVHQVLNGMRSFIIQSLRQTNEIMEPKDGMDMSVCSFDTTTGRLQYAGANSSAYIVRAGSKEVIQLKGDKMPVSIYVKMPSFCSFEYQLYKGDTLYLFTDGYADQFGGPEGKKINLSVFKKLLLDMSHLSLSDQKRNLSVFLYEWMNSGSRSCAQIDDISIIGLRF
jgi:serine phosphatase RsbU (regulator of sigma subunit)